MPRRVGLVSVTEAGGFESITEASNSIYCFAYNTFLNTGIELTLPSTLKTAPLPELNKGLSGEEISLRVMSGFKEN